MIQTCSVILSEAKDLARASAPQIQSYLESRARFACAPAPLAIKSRSYVASLLRMTRDDELK